MPRRNLFILFVVALLSFVCYQKVQTNRYGHTMLKVFDLVEHRYVEPIEGRALFEGAVKGMVGCLDTNSTYFTAKDYETFVNGIKQQFEGVGMEVTQDPQTKQLTVVSPVFGSPAYEKGIRSGDRILAIDGRSTQGIALEDTVALMRGAPGTQVVLSVLHEGDEKPADVTIIRAIIEVDSVLGDTRNADGTWNYFLAGYDKIGYLRLNSFGDKTTREMAAALDKLNAGGMRALILDLRNDPGGRLDTAVDVCDMLVNSGEIVTTRSRGGQIRRRYTAHAKTDFRQFPIAVLVNRYSASASEIVAACLQDHHRAVIVGERTFGKGTVQELIELDEGQGALKLTTASYWRPSGRDINKPKNAPPDADWGVTPDPGYQVTLEGQDLVRWSRWRAHRDGRKSAGPNGDDDARPTADPPLLKALEYIEQSLVRPAAGG